MHLGDASGRQGDVGHQEAADSGSPPPQLSASRYVAEESSCGWLLRQNRPSRDVKFQRKVARQGSGRRGPSEDKTAAAVLLPEAIVHAQARREQRGSQRPGDY